MSVTHHITGPPGTGKTSTLSKQAERAASIHGSDRVMITSFTRAGALEIASRTRVKGVGTLHSIAWHALGRPRIAEANVKEWNEAKPHLRVSPASRDATAPLEGNKGEEGDRLLSAMNVLRAKMVPETQWPLNVRSFAADWRNWCYDSGLTDFTGIIEEAIKDLPYAPGAPKVLIADEVQDFTPLQWKLLRQWAAHTEYLVVAGDDDQLLYGWMGASVEPFLEPVNGERRTLGQSYRLPRAVHAYADDYIRSRVRLREPKEWQPTSEEGAVYRRELKWRDGQRLAEALAEGGAETRMLLASAGYMLAPTLAALRSQGVPFWNPWKRDRGDWNPIREVEGRVSTWQRMLAFLRPHSTSEMWSVGDVKMFAPLFRKKGVLRKTWEYVLEGQDLDRILDPMLLETVFEDWQVTMAGADEYLLEHCLEAKRKPLEYPVSLYRRYGERGFYDDPKVIVGTIHSVKGGEADNVYLLPDLSMAAQQEYARTRDPFHRLAYVGMTRARETLTLCAPSGPGGLTWA